ncbi:MAG: hypothetical protein ACOX3T_05725 [Bdellovibrionota bacterium]
MSEKIEGGSRTRGSSEVATKKQLVREDVERPCGSCLIAPACPYRGNKSCDPKRVCWGQQQEKRGVFPVLSEN